MQLIPVIDLLDGAVVRGQRGERSRYRPIESPLVGSAEPLTVARVLADHCAAACLYIADLGAIMHGQPHTALIAGIAQALPALTLWVDAGFSSRAAADAWSQALQDEGVAPERAVPVFGSESLQAIDGCFGADSPGILSLDRRGSERLDPAGCWDRPEAWPRDVIVMTLERVGSDSGPDLATLAAVQARARPGTRLIGAGGIRNDADLASARRAGAAAWLVASALHDKRLSKVV